MGRAGTAEHVERIVRGWRRVDRKAEARETRERHKSRALHVYQDEDGMVVVRGRLEPEVGAVLMQALAAARELCISGRGRAATEAFPRNVRIRPTLEQQQADALACSRRRRSTTVSIRAPRASATRSWSTSMPPCWRTPTRPASPCSRTARAFPRKRRSAWRATRAGW